MASSVTSVTCVKFTPFSDYEPAGRALTRVSEKSRNYP